MRYARLLTCSAGPLTVAASLVFGATAANAQAPATSLPRPNPPAVYYSSSYGMPAPAYTAPAATARPMIRPVVAPRVRRFTPHNEYGSADSYHYKS